MRSTPWFLCATLSLYIVMIHSHHGDTALAVVFLCGAGLQVANGIRVMR